MKEKQNICLTFDIEEFDSPRVDYKVPLSLERQLDISREGTVRLLDMLKGMGVSATFFVTGVFAQAYPHLVRRMVDEGNEVASHSYAHGEFRDGDYLKSKETLEKITGTQVIGYRSPRMAEIDHKGLTQAGFTYDSSLNPCWLPGKYNNFSAKRSVHRLGTITEVPTSVATVLRIPLFWLSLHLLPIDLYYCLSRLCARKTGFLNIYFHPWEFCEEIHNKDLRIPFYIRRNAGEKLIKRLAIVIAKFKERDAQFLTMSQLVKTTKI